MRTCYEKIRTQPEPFVLLIDYLDVNATEASNARVTVEAVMKSLEGMANIRLTDRLLLA